MVPGPGGEGVLAVNAAGRARRANHNRRTLVVRLVRLRPTATCRQLLPGLLKLLAVAIGVVAIQKHPVALDSAGDHGFSGLDEDGPSLLAVRVEQALTPPALQSCRQLPAQ